MKWVGEWGFLIFDNLGEKSNDDDEDDEEEKGSDESWVKPIKEEVSKCKKVGSSSSRKRKARGKENKEAFCDEFIKFQREQSDRHEQFMLDTMMRQERLDQEERQRDREFFMQLAKMFSSSPKKWPLIFYSMTC